MKITIVLGTAVFAGLAALVLSEQGRWVLALALLGANYGWTIIGALE